MAIVCDTGAIYAMYDADDVNHQAVRRVIVSEPGPLYLPVVLLAEIDYLLTSRLGIDAALDFAESTASGAFLLQPLLQEDIVRCVELMRQYHDLVLGIADCSVVATAERLGIQRLLTLDERHFRAIRPKSLDHFILLPADSAGD